jgi:glycerol-3-phosphate acyltransferase PlsY
MEIQWLILAALAGYLLGSISFSRVIMRVVSPDTDMNKIELKSQDGQMGVAMAPGAATTAAIVKGPKVGCSVGLLDMLKAFLPALGFRLLFPDQIYFLVAATFAMVGHNWPLYTGFKGGGKGVSTMAGGFLAVDPIGIVVSSGLGMILGFVVMRDPLVSYLSGLWLMIPWTAIFLRGWPQLIYVLVVNLLFLLAMVPELKFYIKAKREGKVEMNEGMESTPMGKAMMKLARKLGLERSPKPAAPEKPSPLSPIPVRTASGLETTFRPITPEDSAILGAYFTGLSQETINLYGPHSFDQATADRFCAEIDETNIRLIAVIPDGNTQKVIAYFILHLGIPETEMTRYAAAGIPLDPARDCLIAPSVADAYQNQGLGTPLMEAAFEFARRLGRRNMLLMGGVYQTNERAIHFYWKNGFRDVAPFPSPWNTTKISVDMYREL